MFGILILIVKENPLGDEFGGEVGVALTINQSLLSLFLKVWSNFILKLSPKFIVWNKGCAITGSGVTDIANGLKENQTLTQIHLQVLFLYTNSSSVNSNSKLTNSRVMGLKSRDYKQWERLWTSTIPFPNWVLVW